MDARTTNDTGILYQWQVDTRTSHELMKEVRENAGRPIQQKDEKQKPSVIGQWRCTCVTCRGYVLKRDWPVIQLTRRLSHSPPE